MVKLVPSEDIPPLISTPIPESERKKLFPQRVFFPQEARVERVLGNPLLTAASYLRLAYDAFRDGEKAEAIKALKSAQLHLGTAAGIMPETSASVSAQSEFVKRAYGKR